MICVTADGLGREEPEGFIVDRPYGLSQFLLVRFLVPTVIRFGEEMARAEAGHCVLFSPDYPQWYRGAQGGLLNDWMHLSGSKVGRLAELYGVPLDSVLVPSSTHFLPRLFVEISQERHNREPAWEESIDLLAHQLLLRLGRALVVPSVRLTPVEVEHFDALRELRRSVHGQMEQSWTVASMARGVCLSPSRFTALHRRFFGVSPIEDLLRVRLQHAEELLSNRAMPVSEVATRCGFSSLQYFSHAFRARVGCAPRDYHRRFQAGA